MNPATSGISRDKYDAVLFDLDGVITATARVHAAAWKRMFDEFLQAHSQGQGEPFTPFDTGHDYEQYVDGKPRYDGVQSFLESRRIELPYGDTADAATEHTVCGLGNRKNALIGEVIESEGVDVFDGTIALVHQLRAEGVKTAVVSSSENAGTMLRSAGIEDLFDLRIDGLVVSQLKLPGKPAPDSFLLAAERLGVKPERAVVVEDAIAGVQAGRDGGFGLVIGVDRKGKPASLLDNGADVVVADLSEMLA
jgi:beta-phosphoglucomutase family hydrolase